MALTADPVFFTVYYYLTFSHLVHATGILGILWVLARHLVAVTRLRITAGLRPWRVIGMQQM